MQLYTRDWRRVSERRVHTDLCQPDRFHRGYQRHVDEENTDEDSHDQRKIANEHQSADVARF